VGANFIIGLRHSRRSLREGGLTREEAAGDRAAAGRAGIADYWMVSGSNTETLKYEAAVTPSHYPPPRVFNDLARAHEERGPRAVIVAGRIVTAEQARRPWRRRVRSTSA